MLRLQSTIHEELQIGANHLADNKLALCEQPPLHDLEIVEIDYDGRPFFLDKRAAVAWRKMCATAISDEVILSPYSGFRSYIYQKQLIRRKLDKGKSLEVILTETAIPRFSEHHSGCAVDICTNARFELSEQFENTNAFSWLERNASRFGFRLSYPRNNNKGIIYEPWHWYFQEKLANLT
jgi:D-alanyl-D-alanine carboxypeptidase